MSQNTLEVKAGRDGGVVEESTNGTTVGSAEVSTSNGNAVTPPTPAKVVEASNAMDEDKEPERVQESEPEEDPVAMQLEMEMRGPPQPTESPAARPSTGGFTAINGAK